MADSVLLRLERISKAYPGVVANDAIDLDLHAGEIHGILGENGAGKTTLMGIVYGLLRPDAGRIILEGREAHISSPRVALSSGIGFVQQHFSLIPTLTVSGNVALGLRHAGQKLRLTDAASLVRQLSQRFGLEVEPEAVVEEMSVGKQQRAELLRALARNVRVLILDEPTSVLTPQEAERLAEVLRRLRSEGVGILFISHNLDEVLEISDRITVLRGGRKVATVLRGQATRRDLATMMVGALESANGRPASVREDQEAGDSRLSIRDLWVRGNRGEWAVQGVNLELRSGEILGVAGVEGNGQVELTEALAGVRPWERGEVRLRGKVTNNLTAREAIDRHGIGHVPANRHEAGFVASLPIALNMTLPVLHHERYSRRGALRLDAIKDRAQELMRRFNVLAPSGDVDAGTLSGGNQQRMILARELSRVPEIVIACYATRGLDIAAASSTRDAMRKVRDAGGAVLYASVELNELLELTDRIVVLRDGRITGEVPAAAATAEQLGLWMGGAEQ